MTPPKRMGSSINFGRKVEVRELPLVNDRPLPKNLDVATLKEFVLADKNKKRIEELAAHQYIQSSYLRRLNELRSPVEEIEAAFIAGYQQAEQEDMLTAANAEIARLRSALEKIAGMTDHMIGEITREALKEQPQPDQWGCTCTHNNQALGHVHPCRLALGKQAGEK